MIKFKVLDIKKILKAYIGIITYNLVDPTVDFFKSYVNYHTLASLMTFSLISSSIFMYKHLSQFSLVIESGLIVIGGFQAIGLLLSVGLNEKKVRNLHRALQGIVDKDNGDEVYNIFWKCEHKCRKLAKIIAATIYSVQAVLLCTALMSIYNILIGNLDISTWPSSMNFALPFDANTLWGYYLRIVIEGNIGYTYTSTMTSATSLFVSSCIYIGAICDHFDHQIHSTNENVELMSNEKSPRKYYEMVRKLHQKLSKSIEIHNKIFEIFHMVADINSLGIFALLPVNAVQFAMILHANEYSDSNVVSLLFNVACSIAGMIWPFFYCTYASSTTDQISSIGYAAYDANWYAYSLKLQKYQVLMMARSQKPVYFTGLNLVNCTQEYFGKLLQGSWSYYVVFRGISQL